MGIKQSLVDDVQSRVKVKVEEDVFVVHALLFLLLPPNPLIPPGLFIFKYQIILGLMGGSFFLIKRQTTIYQCLNRAAFIGMRTTKLGQVKGAR